VGVMCDRIGARRVALSGMLLLALCLVSARIIGARLWELHVSMPWWEQILLRPQRCLTA
jgi:hypothetical protein